MDIRIQNSFLPYSDPDESAAFYRDVLGWEVRADVGSGAWRWITVGPPSQPDVSVVLQPPTADPGISEEEGRVIAEMMAKGTYAGLILTSPDLDATFEQLAARGAEVMQEPIEQDYGVRDCAFRDPAGNHIRINQAP